MSTRLFLTCWIIYTLHFSSNIVREIYLALALGDHFSFQVDEYAHLHHDLFETEGRGWHVNNNPGVSMLAALPYAAARPIIDLAVEQVRNARMAQGSTSPPTYQSSWPLVREFYAEAWRRGYDIKFGLAALVMQATCMAPASALAVVLMFHVFTSILGASRPALWLAMLYAFGTPVFFRTGYLNQNLMMGHITFLGFVCLWNPRASLFPSSRMRFLWAGVAGGTALLLDYSGIVPMLGLFLYGIARTYRRATVGELVRHCAYYMVGTAPMVGLLWYYQWRCFGNPLFPAQHWMPAVHYSNQGYQGFTAPQWDLFVRLGFDYRFGLFTTCPLFLLAGAVFLLRDRSSTIANREIAAMLLLSVAFSVFFSCCQYSRLQFNSGVRHLAPVFPLLFVPAGLVLIRMPIIAVACIAIGSVSQAWCMAMYRDVERGLGVLEPLAQVFLGGFRLPILTVLSQMDAYREYFPFGPSPLPVFVLMAVVVFGIWTYGQRLNPLPSNGEGISRNES